MKEEFSNFITEIIDKDIATNKYGGRVHTRFPPEPNGYLHIGHAKSIWLNFTIAHKYNGLCNLRMDDTDPSKEDEEFVKAIIEDVRWLGYDWGERLYFASDYYEQLYEYAVRLIQKGKAYVCGCSPEQVKELRGTLTEQKRKIIGEEFIRVFESTARKIGNIKYLAQGTLYPDVIESQSVFGGPSAKIKTHHNVGGLPERMKLRLIEPLRFLFKDEVRKIGHILGLPDEVVYRHPFPGPGLAVRIIGEVTRSRLDILREADAIIIEEIKRDGFYPRVWQAFGVLLPVKSVGVMGDERTYENVLALRVVRSLDGMTADWVKLPYFTLGKIANRIINEVRGINRVVYDISSKPPATIEWE